MEALCTKLRLGAGALSQIRRCPCPLEAAWALRCAAGHCMGDDLRAAWGTQTQGKACPRLTELRTASYGRLDYVWWEMRGRAWRTDWGLVPAGIWGFEEEEVGECLRWGRGRSRVREMWWNLTWLLQV